MGLPILEQGIRFECQQSGACCTSRGEYGFIYLTDEDRDRLAAALGSTVDDFVRTHCATTDGWLHLEDPQLDCRFLAGTRCSVYDARPKQCRTWPFWPENMDSRTWNEEIAVFCAGVGVGRLWSRQEVESILEEQGDD